MPSKDKQIPQPTIDRQRRSSEARSVWFGLTLAILALVLVLCGAFLTRRVAVADGKIETMREADLVKAATLGALQRGERSLANFAEQTGDQRASQNGQLRPVVKKTQTDDDFCYT